MSSLLNSKALQPLLISKLQNFRIHEIREICAFFLFFLGISDTQCFQILQHSSHVWFHMYANLDWYLLLRFWIILTFFFFEWKIKYKTKYFPKIYHLPSSLYVLLYIQSPDSPPLPFSKKLLILIPLNI